jgi:hypothetical protein
MLQLPVSTRVRPTEGVEEAVAGRRRDQWPELRRMANDNLTAPGGGEGTIGRVQRPYVWPGRPCLRRRHSAVARD